MTAPLSVLPKIVLVDFGGTGLLQNDLMALATALEIQVNTQFALPPPLGYGLEVASIRLGSSSAVPQISGGIRLALPASDEIVCGFFAAADQPGALGYHDRTPSGLPLIKCFPLLDKSDGSDWRVTPSHEILEELKDPELSCCAQAPDGKIWAYEVCDAVEQDTYRINGVPVSNWNTPAYFEPPSDLKDVRLDWMGLCKTPGEVRPGGYAQFWDGGQWQQVLSQARAPRSYRMGNIGRRMRRIAKHQKVVG